MNPGEHAVMARVEASHWWYQGLRDVMARCLARPDLSLPNAPRVLDAGCGTGENLRFLQELLAPGYLGGFDPSEDALGFARDKVAGADVYRSDVCEPEIRAGELDLIVSTDVIYIPGVERALPGLQRLVEQLRAGGLLLLNLPAYDWLYSEHDQAIHTRERYTRGQVEALLSRLGLIPVVSSYRLCFLFPLVLITRAPSMWRARRQASEDAKSDLYSVPGPFVNRSLSGIVRAENRMIARGARMPFGSSVFTIARKPAA